MKLYRKQQNIGAVKLSKPVLTSTFMLLILMMSCSIEPSSIDYGHDGCHFCKMTIVDRQHAAQIVTNKGKAFKYDAIECMMNDLRDKGKSQIGLFLINDYSQPGQLVDATESSFLISQNIPSPMGDFLSGFKSESKAIRIKSELGGTILTWTQLKRKYD